MEGLENTITVMLAFGGAAAFLWTIDKVLGLFGKNQETKLRYSSKLPYFLIGITIIGVDMKPVGNALQQTERGIFGCGRLTAIVLTVAALIFSACGEKPQQPPVPQTGALTN